MPDIPPKDPKTGKFLPSGAAATAEPPPEPPKLTKEQEENLVEFTTRALGGKPTEKTQLDKEKVDKEKAEKEKKAAAAKAKPKPKPAAAPAPAPTAKEIAVEVGAEVAERLLAKKGEPEKKVEPAAPELPKGEKRRIAVLERMEKENPAQYKGLKDRYLGAKAELQKYADKWVAEHPGQEFDAEAEEHQAAIDKINENVDWDDDDYEEAREAVLKDGVREEVKKEYEPKLTELERKEQLRQKMAEVAPIVQKGALTAARTFWESLGDDFKDILDEKGVPNHEKLAALKAEDEDLYNVRVNHALLAENDAAMLFRIFNGVEDYIAPPAKDDPDYKAKMAAFQKASQTPAYAQQQALGNFCQSKEQEMEAMSPEDQAVTLERLRPGFDGSALTYAPAAQYRKMSKRDRALHWTLEPADFAKLRAKNLAKEARKLVEAEEERFRKRAEARGLKPAEKNGRASKPPVEEVEPEPEPDDDKPNSPNLAPASRTAMLKNRGSPSEKNGVDAFVEGYLK